MEIIHKSQRLPFEFKFNAIRATIHIMPIKLPSSSSGCVNEDKSICVVLPPSFHPRIMFRCYEGGWCVLCSFHLTGLTVKMINSVKRKWANIQRRQSSWTNICRPCLGRGFLSHALRKEAVLLTLCVHLLLRKLAYTEHNNIHLYAFLIY